MTNAAHYVFDLEHAHDQRACEDILRVAKDDQIFAAIARLTFDPFMQWRHTGAALPALLSTDLDAIEQDLEKSWANFAGFLTEHANTDVSDDFSWSRSWPIYARVLLKRVATDAVSHSVVAHALGTLPLWFIGTAVKTGEIEYPIGVQPFIPGTRAFAIIASPTNSLRDVWFLSQTGLPFPVPVPHEIRLSVQGANFAMLPAHYADGVVLDGVINLAGYSVFDLIPLACFREQSRTEGFRTRTQDLTRVRFGPQVHHVPVIVAADKNMLADAVGKLRRRTFGRVVLKRLQDPYPFFAEHYCTESWLLADSTTI